MRKNFTILFLAVYLTLSVGMNVLVHTCGSESQVSLATTSAKDPCVCSDGSASTEEPSINSMDMCCTTVVTAIQIDDVQKIIPVHTEQNVKVIAVVHSTDISSFDIRNSSFVVSLDTSPPPKIDLYISNSVFLI